MLHKSFLFKGASAIPATDELRKAEANREIAAKSAETKARNQQQASLPLFEQEGGCKIIPGIRAKQYQTDLIENLPPPMTEEELINSLPF
jgi:hypothetical protein